MTSRPTDQPTDPLRTIDIICHNCLAYGPTEIDGCIYQYRTKCPDCGFEESMIDAIMLPAAA